MRFEWKSKSNNLKPQTVIIELFTVTFIKSDLSSLLCVRKYFSYKVSDIKIKNRKKKNDEKKITWTKHLQREIKFIFILLHSQSKFKINI